MIYYLLCVLEGIITFISPCLLPMLPIYISYFAGGAQERSTGKTLKNALGFVLGFTTLFVLMGALAGSLGSLLIQYRTALNIITGAVAVFFGLSFMGVFTLDIFKGISGKFRYGEPGFFSSLLFGVIFSVGWTPCMGAFLGSALMLATQKGSTMTGIIMLLLYSLGLGIPFIVSALLIDKLKTAFTFIKKHYSVINKICGALLVIVGILMMTGILNRLITILG